MRSPAGRTAVVRAMLRLQSGDLKAISATNRMVEVSALGWSCLEVFKDGVGHAEIAISRAISKDHQQNLGLGVIANPVQASGMQIQQIHATVLQEHPTAKMF